MFYPVVIAEVGQKRSLAYLAPLLGVSAIVPRTRQRHLVAHVYNLIIEALFCIEEHFLKSYTLPPDNIITDFQNAPAIACIDDTA